MKCVIVAIALFSLMACSLPTTSDKISQFNNGYNYCVNINNQGDSINSGSKMSMKDSILLQFAEGFNNDTLRISTDKNEYREVVFSEDESLGYSGFIKLASNAKEIKFNVNGGPIILLSILTKKVFFIQKKENNIEILGLNQPARFK